ncbi:MAG: DUF429 domain-containing protein [Cyanobacteria bacterium J06631_12]
MRFIGIDLGWQSGPSGLCCLGSRYSDGEFELHIEQIDRKATLDGVLGWIDAIAPLPTPAIIAVDAPTLIPNETGMRSPDRLAHKYFGKYHAGCYPANLGRPFAQRIIQFGQALERRGFCHAPTVKPQKIGRYQVEVFPHPATIQLFNLPQILKYKKGRLADRRQALGELRNYLLTSLPRQNPPLNAVSLPEVPAGGKALKALEDKLDSIVCAYVAAHWWYWGEERNHVLGGQCEGYIVVPCPPNAPVQLGNSAENAGEEKA